MLVRRSLFSTLAVLLFASRALSQAISVPDYNFLNPSAGTVGFATLPSSTAGLGNWQVSPPTPGFLYYEETYGSLSADQATTNWYDQAGVFYNNPQGAYIDNISLSGSQAAYMYDTPGLQLSQTLSSTFQVGKSYQLTVALAGGNQTAPMPLNDPIDIGLYYMSGGSQTLIGTPTTVLNDDSGWNGYYIYQLNDYSLTIPAVGAGDPWAGQNIGVALFEPNNADGSGAFWDVDNVRLTAAVPEPGSMTLLAAAGLGLFVLRRRWSSGKQPSAAAD